MVGPSAHAYVYGGVPPFGVMSMDPVLLAQVVAVVNPETVNAEDDSGARSRQIRKYLMFSMLGEAGS